MSASQHDIALDAFIGPASELRRVDDVVSTAFQISRRTLVVVGHLPVMSGLWISQFADREACTGGATCLVRIEHDAVLLEVFRAGTRRPSISPQASIVEALRTIAPIAARWMVVSRAGGTTEVPGGITDIVVLSGADEVAVVAAYELVKTYAALVGGEGAPRVPISVAVLGADDAAVEHVARRLRGATRQFLGFEVAVAGGLQAVAPVDSAFRGTFNAPAPTLVEVDAMLDSAQRAAEARDERVSVSMLPTRESSRTVVAHDAPRTAPRERFAANNDRRGPRSRAARDESPIPITVGLEPSPAVAEENVRETRATARRRSFDAPPLHAKPPEAHAPGEFVDSSAARTSSGMDALRAEIGRASAELDAFRRTRAPIVEPSSLVGLHPEPASVGRARSITSDITPPLLEHLEGIVPFPFRAPRNRLVEVGLDATGRAHVVGRAADLAALLAVRAWMREQDEILRAAVPTYTSHEDIVIDVVFASFEEVRPIDGVMTHVALTVEVAGRRGVLAVRISA
jgi:hypothetical protein